MCDIGPDFMLRHILAPVDISFHCMVVLDDELDDFFLHSFLFVLHFSFPCAHTH